MQNNARRRAALRVVLRVVKVYGHVGTKTLG